MQKTCKEEGWESSEVHANRSVRCRVSPLAVSICTPHYWAMWTSNGFFMALLMTMQILSCVLASTFARAAVHCMFLESTSLQNLARLATPCVDSSCASTRQKSVCTKTSVNFIGRRWRRSWPTHAMRGLMDQQVVYAPQNDEAKKSCALYLLCRWRADDPAAMIAFQCEFKKWAMDGNIWRSFA